MGKSRSGKEMGLKEEIRLALLRAASHWPASVSAEGRTGSSEPANILLIRPDHLGDVLFTTPALRALRGALPDARIAYMVGEWSAEVVAQNPNIDEIITCRFPGFSRGRRGSLLSPYLQLRREASRLRSFHFDAAINLRFDFWWGAMLACFAGIPQRIGYDVRECVPFLSHAVPYSGTKHEVERNLELIQRFVDGKMKSGAAPELEFPTNPTDEAFAEEWLSPLGQGPLVAIHPGAGWPVKLWPTEGFAQVADRLADRFGAKIVVTGSPAEQGLIEELSATATTKVHPLTSVGLGKLAAVLRRCSLVIGVDSGVLHLAVAVRTPTVHLYGPVSHVTFGPWGDANKHIVVRSDLPCAPCNRLDFPVEELGQHPCIRDIPVERVLAAAVSLLSR